MSGDSHRNDESDDFLDEDFVVEDLGGKNDDLEDLFDAPAQPGAEAEAAEGDDIADPDSDDVLFTDHTAGLEGTEVFEKPSFDEDGASQWDGERLDLEEVNDAEPIGVPEAQLDDEEQVGGADPQLTRAEEAFTQELDGLLQSSEGEREDDFELDSEAELELVSDGDGEDGVSEFEQSGPFVLDDGDGLWAEDAEEAASADAQPSFAGEAPVDDETFVAEPPVAFDDEEEAAPNPFVNQTHEPIAMDAADGQDELEEIVEPGYDEMGLREAASADAVEQPGWEPLPGKSMDELSEVDEVQRTDEDEEYYDDDDEEAGYEDEAPAYEDVEGHDIYGEDEGEPEAVVVGGPGNRKSRWGGLLLSLAASLVVLMGAATVVVRPEWFGLKIEPESVASVDLPRPRIEVPLDEPAAMPAPATAEDPTPNGGEVLAGGTPETGAPTETPTDTPTGPETPDTVAQTSTDEPVGGAGEKPVEPQQPQLIASQAGTDDPAPTTTPTQTPPGGGAGEVPVVGDGSVADSWPVAQAGEEEAPEGPEALTRFGDSLLVGGLLDGDGRRTQVIDGVMPGSRAFAQLHNGNYFIGRVKQVAESTITLRLDDGEVTLATQELAQLTRLGSSDYEELQKATKGFVRLRNNNRLVGGILSKIADDHVVLEFRKNRVMLPRSAIGEIVQGDEDEGKVRLDTTREEDDWVRSLAERKLGTGTGAATSETAPGGQDVPPVGPPR